MRVLVALGGNAMTGPDGDAAPVAQQTAVEIAMERIGELVHRGHELVITHGNGPQVGNLLAKNELAADVVPPVPLDWCGAQTQGSIGVLIMNALDKVLTERGLTRPVATLVTRTLVDGDDPGFTHPTKPIGRYLPELATLRLRQRGQTWEDRGAKGWRRVVASPEPVRVLDAAAIETLLRAGFVVVAGGGGGVPTIDRGAFVGVEAVLDKDLTAALLGLTINADVLVIATDVGYASIAFGTPRQRDLDYATPAEMRDYAAAGHFSSGSMGPKVEAAARFVENGGRRAVITSLECIADAVQGRAGTVIEKTPHHRMLV